MLEIAQRISAIASCDGGYCYSITQLFPVSKCKRHDSEPIELVDNSEGQPEGQVVGQRRSTVSIRSSAEAVSAGGFHGHGPAEKGEGCRK